MKHIEYFPKSDLAVPHYIENSKLLLTNIYKEDHTPDINDIVSISNILRYMKDGLAKQLGHPDSKLLIDIIIKFKSLHSTNSILNNFNKLSKLLEEDFWIFFITFNLYETLEEKDFNTFLINKQPNIYPILTKKPLVNKFNESLKEYFLSNPKNAHYLIDKNSKKILKM